MYQPKHFDIKELVSEAMYRHAQEKGVLWKLWYLFNTELLISADRIREFIGCGITINNWSHGGNFDNSGFRDPDSAIERFFSQHKRGNALDLKFNSSSWTPEKLRLHMLNIGAFEDGFRLRTDKEAYPFVLLRQIEWIGKSWRSLDGEMSWFHIATNPDVFAGQTPEPSTRISVIGNKGVQLLKAV